MMITTMMMLFRKVRSITDFVFVLEFIHCFNKLDKAHKTLIQNTDPQKSNGEKL